MNNIKNLASLVILSTGSLLITGCGFFGSDAVRVINLSKLDVPDSNLAIIDSRQKQRFLYTKPRHSLVYGSEFLV